MKKYILLDLDNTIIDFNECARQSIIRNFARFDLPYIEGTTFEIFTKTNNELWGRLERGEITKDELRAIRWNLVFSRLGIDFDGPTLETLFENGIAESAYPVDGAYELLEYLYKKYKIYIASNGFAAVQRNRLKIGNFEKYVTDLFVSEEIGHQKPSKEFFEICLERMGDPEKENVILIGDNIHADVFGGNSVGIDTVWFNRNKDKTEKIIPTYTVFSLEEIKNIL